MRLPPTLPADRSRTVPEQASAVDSQPTLTLTLRFLTASLVEFSADFGAAGAGVGTGVGAAGIGTGVGSGDGVGVGVGVGVGSGSTGVAGTTANGAAAWWSIV